MNGGVYIITIGPKYRYYGATKNSESLKKYWAAKKAAV